MIKEPVHDTIFLAGKSEAATKEDLRKCKCYKNIVVLQ